MAKKTTKTANSPQTTDYSQKAVVSRQSAVSHSLKGLVVAAKLPKTVTVIVERSKMHRMYQKAVKRSKKYLVHDEIGVKEGDVVEIIQCKPVSANKRFMISKVVGQDIATIINEDLKVDVAEAIAEVMPEEVETELAESAVSAESEEKTETVKNEETKKPKKRVKKETK